MTKWKYPTFISEADKRSAEDAHAAAINLQIMVD